MIVTKEAIQITETTTSFRINIHQNPDYQDGDTDETPGRVRVPLEKEPVAMTAEHGPKLRDQRPTKPL